MPGTQEQGPKRRERCFARRLGVRRACAESKHLSLHHTREYTVAAWSVTSCIARAPLLQSRMADFRWDLLATSVRNKAPYSSLSWKRQGAAGAQGWGSPGTLRCLEQAPAGNRAEQLAAQSKSVRTCMAAVGQGGAVQQAGLLLPGAVPPRIALLLQVRRGAADLLVAADVHGGVHVLGASVGVRGGRLLDLQRLHVAPGAAGSTRLCSASLWGCTGLRGRAAVLSHRRS